MREARAALLEGAGLETRRMSSRPPRLAERAFAVVLLFLLTGGLVPLLRLETGGVPDELEGDPVIQMIWASLYAATAVLLLGRRRQAVAALAREKWVAIFVLLAIVSTAWSEAPAVTARRALALVGTTMIGVYLAVGYTTRGLLSLVALVLATVAALSAAFALAAPSYGMMTVGGADVWRGIFVHKNILGRIMALAAMLAVLMLCAGRRPRLLAVGLFGLSLAVLVRSGSMTSVLIAVCLVGLVPLVLTARWRYTAAVPMVLAAALVVLAVGVLLASHAEVALHSVSRESTLSGRTALWPAVAQTIAERPWLGHAYGAFWLGRDGPSAAVWSLVAWQPTHAHNGILDLGLELGVVGVVVFAVGFARAAGRALRQALSTSAEAGCWPVLYLVFMFASNIGENTVLVRNSIFWALYVCVALSLPARGGPGARVAG